MALSCFRYPISPKVVAIATDKAIRPPLATFPDPVNLSGAIQPQYGQDITYGYGRAAPGKEDVGATPDILKPKMRKLLTVFASGDRSGMATRLFDAFLQASGHPVTYFDNPALNAAIATHPNIRFFCDAALSAPNLLKKSPPGAIRIHQALKKAGWDITKIQAPTDLGVPAFNQGLQTLRTGDFDNGLGLMINGVQHAYVVATHYFHDKTANCYCIRLKYIFYDVFGLDDEDLRKNGAASDFSGVADAVSRSVPQLSPFREPIVSGFQAGVGITAWWQLQHQHNYAPLVTRAIVTKEYVAPAQ